LRKGINLVDLLANIIYKRFHLFDEHVFQLNLWRKLLIL